MNHPSLQVYTLVSRWSLLKNYQGKIMVVAFWGTHVPLLTLLLYFIMSASLSASTTVRVLLIALSATLVGTGITLELIVINDRLM
ncbi:MAG: hypothetical protein M3R24_40555 [Chloroflexota bacterium]|nr:hypothetical protein [Chloroflexota bacterium]